MIKGCLNWIVTLGRTDAACAASSLDRFSSGQWEGNMSRALRISGYLKKHLNLELLHDPTEIHQIHNGITDNRMELMVQCTNAVEEIDSGLLHANTNPYI